MKIINNTVFPFHWMIIKDINLQYKLVFIIKGTFDIIGNQKSEIAAQQIPIAYIDEYYGEKVPGSIRIERDIAPFKPRTDIVCIANAYAPNGQAVSSFVVTLKIGDINKSIAVIGDRYWKKSFGLTSSLVPSAPLPIKVMEITYERAYGGIDLNENYKGEWCEENPVGRGFIAKKCVKFAQNKPLPNLEDPNNLIRSWRDRPRPVGFGFYGQGWSPRVKYAGTYDERWQKERAPDLPIDFNPAFYNGAHPDLQINGYLRGDEVVEMKNLTPEGYIKFYLSGIYPKVKIVNSQNQINTRSKQSNLTTEDLNMNLDTICFLPDEKIFYQVWRGLYTIKKCECNEIEKIIIEV